MNRNKHKNWKLFKNQFLFDFFALKEIKKIFKTKKLNPMKIADDMKKYSKHHQSIEKTVVSTYVLKKRQYFSNHYIIYDAFCIIMSRIFIWHYPIIALARAVKVAQSIRTVYIWTWYIHYLINVHLLNTLYNDVNQLCIYMRVTPFVYCQSLSRLFHV